MAIDFVMYKVSVHLYSLIIKQERHVLTTVVLLKLKVTKTLPEGVRGE